MTKKIELIHSYINAFNQQNVPDLIACLDNDVIHDINQENTEIGIEAFSKFMRHMNSCYKEIISELEILTNEDGTHAAVEGMVEGNYIKTDLGLPEAKNQFYRLPFAGFFKIKNNKISRVTIFYNLKNWLEQIQS